MMWREEKKDQGEEVSLKIASLLPKYIVKSIYSAFWSVKIPCKQIPEGAYMHVQNRQEGNAINKNVTETDMQSFVKVEKS